MNLRASFLIIAILLVRLPLSAATFEFFQVRDAARASAWSKQTNIQIGNNAYGDGTVTITSLPAGLSGRDWIRTANGSNGFAGYDVVKFRMDAPGATALQLFIDAGVTPSWLSDYAWTATGETIGLSNGRSLKGYSKLCFRGSMVSLEGLNNSTVNNYVIIAKPTTVPGAVGWARADAIVAAVQPPAFRQVDYNVLSYGAVGNNMTNNYVAFKSAVNTCAADGGGRVLVPNGNYIINGPIELKSGVRLHLADGAKLYFRGTKADYLRGTGPQGTTTAIFNGIEYMGAMTAIYANHATGVAVTGDNPLTCAIDFGWGTIPWTDPPSPQIDKEIWNGAHTPVIQRVDVNERPIAVNFQFCTSVWVEGIQINKSPLWCLVPWNCDKVLIKNTRIVSEGHNNDGITPLASTNVVIDGCYIKPGDDGLSLKSLRNEDGFRYCRPLMDMVIQNCLIKPSAGRLLEVGSETSGGVKNIFVRNIREENPGNYTARFGIKMSFMRAGFVEGFFVRDSDVGEFRIWKHSDNDSRYDYSNQMNYVRDIYFENCSHLTVVGSLFGKGPPYDRPHIDNVRFINCPITRHPVDDPLSFINVDYNASGYGLPTGNQSPTVAITSPANGASFTAPATVAIQASASDTDGTIANVEFFRNGTSIGVDTTAPFTASAASLAVGTYTLTARATDNGGATTTSAAVTITVNGAAVAPAITSQPVNKTVTAPATATFTVTASGSPAPTFQWQSAPSGSTTFTAISAATAASYTTRATTTSMSGTQYRCVATNSVTSVTSNVAILTVTAGTIAPAITSQPVNTSVTAGGTATFTVAASGTPVPTIQWQRLISATWTNISGATSATYSVTTVLGDNGAQFRAVATNSVTTATSSVATLTVTSGGSTGTGTGLTGTYFNDMTLTNAALTRTDAQVGFNWGNGSPAAGVPADHFSVRWTGTVEAQYTQTYTFFTTSDDGVRLWVNGQQVVNNWTNHGSTENSGTIALTAGVQYAITMEYFENTGGSVAQLRWSSPATVKALIPQSQLYPASVVAVAPAFTSQPANASVTAGATATFTVAASGSPAPTYQWQSAPPGSATFTAISGATAASYTTGATATGMSGTAFRCVATNSVTSATSNGATLTVTAPTTVAPAITSQPANATVVEGATATFTVTASGSPAPTYQWSSAPSGSGTFTAISGATAASYTTPAASPGMNGTQYRCVATNSVNSATSAVATLTVGVWSSTDIGAVAAVGSSAFVGGTWTLTGSGVDIWNASDEFRFTSQSVSGDVVITARLTGLQNTNPWAKAGVMVRETFATGSRHAFTCLTGANGAGFQRRLNTNGASTHTGGPALAAPGWVRLERVGNLFISSVSPDGTTWTEIRRETITMAANVQVGLAVTSHADGTLCTATFTDVTVVSAPVAAN